MQNAGTVAEKNLARLGKSNGQPEAQDSEAAITVWQALGQMFGSAFLSSYGPRPPMLWEQAIRRLTDHELQRGMKALAEEGRKFPPNLTEFVSACKTLPPTRFLGVEDKTDYKQIAAQRSTPEHAAEQIAKIRKNLGRA